MIKKIYNLLREFSFKEMIQSISLSEILSFFQISDTIQIKKSLLLVWTIMIFSVFIVLWASLSEINQVVVGNGEVTPESQLHQIHSINAQITAKIKWIFNQNSVFPLWTGRDA